MSDTSIVTQPQTQVDPQQAAPAAPPAVAEAPPAVAEAPPAQETMPMMPALPIYTELQELAHIVASQAEGLKAHARNMQVQGQLMLQDLWRQQESFIHDLQKLDAECEQEVSWIIKKFQSRKDTLRRQIDSLQSQIDYHGAMPQMPTPISIAAPVSKPQNKQSGGFMDVLRQLIP